MPSLLPLWIFLGVRLTGTSAVMIMSAGVGWQIYELTGSALSLGLVGLAQFLPMALVSWAAGDAADRYDRRLILGLSYAADCLVAMALIGLTLFGANEWAFYAVLVLFGISRAFGGPAGQALLPRIVPESMLPRAIAWSSTTFQMAVIGGPALGGLLLTLGADIAYGVCAVLFAAALIGTQFLRMRDSPPNPDPIGSAWERAIEGLHFVQSRPVILGAISLDLFAVLFGGVTALLPIFAKDVLMVGADGFGLLRSAPAAGAALISIMLGMRPLNRRVGAWMFTAVALFGVFTIVFALSTSFWLSLSCLVILGAADMISVFIRSSLIQLGTPDHMRGRVSAVNLLFIGASNELGEFESGLMAAWVGAVNAALVGGIGTLAIVAIWMALFPPLRKVDRFEDSQQR